MSAPVPAVDEATVTDNATFLDNAKYYVLKSLESKRPLLLQVPRRVGTTPMVLKTAAAFGGDFAYMPRPYATHMSANLQLFSYFNVVIIDCPEAFNDDLRDFLSQRPKTCTIVVTQLELEDRDKALFRNQYHKEWSGKEEGIIPIG